MTDWKAKLMKWKLDNTQKRAGSHPGAQETASGPAINSIAQADSVIKSCTERPMRVRADSKSWTWDGGIKGPMKPEPMDECRKLRDRIEEVKKLKTGLQ